MNRKQKVFFTPRELPNTRVGADMLLGYLRQESCFKIKDHPLLPSYIMSVCSSMEDVINKEYCLYFAKTYSIGYKELANTFIGLNIEKKLIHLFPTISENKYMLDMKNEMVKYTLKVFRLRNKLIHQPNELIPVYLNQVSKGIFIETPIDNESNKKMNSLTDEWPDIS